MKHSELRHQPRHVNPRIQDILPERTENQTKVIAAYLDAMSSSVLKRPK